MKVRKQAVAGYFYSEDSASLSKEVNLYLASDVVHEKALAVVMPHAGYLYSGEVAGKTAASVAVPDTVVILCPKHTPYGANLALSDAQAWQIPFGEIPVNREFADLLLSFKNNLFRFDSMAHAKEHSAEVLLPFLYKRNPNISIVPVAYGPCSYDEVEATGRQLAFAIEKWQGDVLIAASSDMSHQIPQVVAEKLDSMAIEQIINLNSKGLYNTVKDNNISMCGVIPVTAALVAANHLGAKKASLIQYSTSAKATLDTSSVVGYAGMVIY